MQALVHNTPKLTAKGIFPPTADRAVQSLTLQRGMRADWPQGRAEGAVLPVHPFESPDYWPKAIRFILLKIKQRRKGGKRVRPTQPANDTQTNTGYLLSGPLV